MEHSIKKEIEQLKHEKDVVILAHYYVDGKVIEGLKEPEDDIAEKAKDEECGYGKVE